MNNVVDIIRKESYEFIVVHEGVEFSIYREGLTWYAYYPESEDDIGMEIIRDDNYDIFGDTDSVILENGYCLTKDFLLDLQNRTTNTV